eukprot:COSAG04_NODE_6596_length_1297_cov_1.161102_1_plen_124_part_10
MGTRHPISSGPKALLTLQHNAMVRMARADPSTHSSARGTRSAASAAAATPPATISKRREIRASLTEKEAADDVAISCAAASGPSGCRGWLSPEAGVKEHGQTLEKQFQELEDVVAGARPSAPVA